ncbi:transglutaminaseTgpA domain-containing protein [Nocardioides sp. GXQ0305]|uniref:transglutaminase family protein n=1 Tax=Nocardioides sp. GXQ0305 TaxID=3423912 RepID=UPI003D7DDC7C
MSRSRRPAVVDVLAMSIAAAATTWLATLAWLGFTRQPGGYLGPLLGLALLVAAVGGGLRRLHLPGALVLAAQLVVGIAAISFLLTGSPLPVGDAFTELLRSFSTAVTNAQQYRAPVPAEGSIDPLLVVGGWVCMVLVDLLACTLRRVPLAGLPLLAIYSIPVSMLGGGVAWWAFALTSAGFLLMLYLQHGEAVSRWGRSLEVHRGLDGQSSTVRASAGSMGAAAVAVAVVAPLLVPTLSLGLFGFGPGDGTGSDISIDNPMTDLRRDLLRGEDVPLLRVTTDDPDPTYLRIAALNRFSDNEWSTDDRDIPVDQRADGSQLPLPEIDRSVERTQYDYDVTALSQFQSRWLPAHVPTTRIAAAGDWRYDVETLDFLSADEDLDAAGLSYTFTRLDLDLEAETLAASPSSAGEVDSSYRDLPGDLPPLVGNLATEVTRDYPTRYEKAVALQDWFREDGGFEYSLETATPGNGPDALTAFLTEGQGGRVGYCEQFASAMGAMARSLGIPARVAVGFLEPQQVGLETYEYSSDDMHAWPELYFSGAGWIRFEPTPADRASGVPSYTAQNLPQLPENEPTDAATQPQGQQPTAGQDPRLDEGVQPGDESGGGGGGFPWWPVLGGVAGGLLVVVLLLLPRTVRRRQSVGRLQGPAEPAWAELEATARDLGVPWPSGRSPRQTRDRLVDHLGSTHPDDQVARPRRGAEVSPDGVEALDRLVLAVERLRYSRGRDASDPEAVVGDTRTVVAALHGGADESARRRARWWPASVLPWRRRRGARASEEPELVSGSLVDHVG